MFRALNATLVAISMILLASVPAQVQNAVTLDLVWHEAQAWWMPAGSSDFQRIHLGTRLPTTTVTGVLGLDVRLLVSHLPGVHDPGTVGRLEAKMGDGDPIASHNLSWHPTQAVETTTVQVTLDTSELPDGWHPLHVLAEVVDPRGQRRYVGLRASVQVSNGGAVGSGRPQKTSSVAIVQSPTEEAQTVETALLSTPTASQTTPWESHWLISQAEASAVLPHAFFLSVNATESSWEEELSGEEEVSPREEEVYANEWQPSTNPFEISVHLGPGRHRVFARTTDTGSMETLTSVLEFDVDVEGRQQAPTGPESLPAADPEPSPLTPSFVGTVQNREALLTALANATSGDVVYIADDAEINMTGDRNIGIPSGVTLASNGGLLYTDELDTKSLLRTLGASVRVTGLRLRGPDSEPHHGFGAAIPRSRAIEISHPGAEIDHNEISAWTHAGVAAYPGSGSAHIHDNDFHHIQLSGLGYGVVVDQSTPLIEHNVFDFCRMAVAGTGKPDTAYEARFNTVRPSVYAWPFDMHPQGSTAGDWVHIHHNDIQTTDGAANVVGRPFGEIFIQGIPNHWAKVHDNRFAVPEVDIVSQRVGGDIVSTVPEFVNIEIYDNVFEGP